MMVSGGFSKIAVLVLFFAGFLVTRLPARTWEVSSDDTGFTLQSVLNRAASGDTLVVPAGQYECMLHVKKSITLLGEDWPVLDGKDRGTVLTIDAAGVTVRNFVIRNSGKSLSREDAGIAVNAPNVIIEDNQLEEVLFGIYLRQAHHSIVRGNRISGKQELAVPRRGDLIRAWYSDSLIIEKNITRFGRDVIIWFSQNTVLRKNEMTNARYGVHFMYSNDCTIEENILTGNSVGAYLMYSRRLLMKNNTIAYNRGPSGFGIGLKDFDDGRLFENMIVDNRIGIFVDNSPREVQSTMIYHGNVIAYNDIGMHLLSTSLRSDLEKNSFLDNYQQVAVGGREEVESGQWLQNYWSDYSGYDADGNGYGDLPYKSEKLFENLMKRHSSLRLLIYSPAIQAINFAARAFPVVNPESKFQDAEPRMHPYFPAGIRSPGRHIRWGLLSATIGLMAFGVLLMLGFSAKNTGRRFGSPAAALKDRNSLTDVNMGRNNREGGAPVIEVLKLKKNFGKFTAIDSVSFRVATGEAVALWGANGAGKTTILRCLLGVIPCEGQAIVKQLDVAKAGKEARRIIGFVPQEISFHDNLTVKETLDFYAQLKKTTQKQTGSWLGQLKINILEEKKIKELSGGMKQRVALAIALLSDPPVLFLDEATANLDLQARQDFIELLKDLKKQGKTILFSSHRMEEIRAFADRVILLEHGRVIADSRPSEIYRQSKGHGASSITDKIFTSL